MPTKIDQWSLSESRIKTLLCQKLITHTEIAELFEIMHKYNAVPKLIPEELSEWCNSKSIELRNKSRSLDKALGITKDVRVTDNLAMSMVVNDIWAQIFKEESQVKAFQIVAKKYDVEVIYIENGFLKHWEHGLNYYLVLNMKSLSPFEIGLVCSNLKSVIKINSDAISMLDKNGDEKRKAAIEKFKKMQAKND
ncbi:hypothetical protein N8901_00890 [Gammaproteobacteria bacterium]|nr:hypothetical protein [Gammaproteobacteria bacterium]